MMIRYGWLINIIEKKGVAPLTAERTNERKEAHDRPFLPCRSRAQLVVMRDAFRPQVILDFSGFTIFAQCSQVSLACMARA